MTQTAAASGARPEPVPAAPTYPDAPRLDLVEDVAGHQVADPYRWLEDDASEQTQAWSAAQDALLAGQRETWPGRDRFRARLTELLGAGIVSAPVWRGQRQFFMRRTADQEHAQLLTVDPDGTERVLVDPMALDASGLTTLDSWQPSKEGSLLAYQLSEGGTEESVLRVVDVVTGEVVDGPVDRARYSPVAWLPGGEAYYFVRRLPPDQVPAGEEQFHRRVWFHRLGTDHADDVLVFGEGRKATEYFGVSVSRDGCWLVVSAAEGTAPRNDLWIADLAAPGTDPGAPDLRPVQVDVDAQTGLEVGRDGRLYVFTDLDAPRGRVCVTTPDRPTVEHWRDLLPEDPVAVLDGFAVLDGPELDDPVLLASWTRHAVSEVTLHDLVSGQRRGQLELPGLGSVGGIIERPEGGHEAWFGYTDHVTPSSVQHYDARTGTVSVWATAPGTVDVPDVHSRQVAYASADGTVVRMFVLSPADGPDRPRPTILYGYGGFGVPLTPAYSATVLAWVEAGGVYAIANLRGGGEEGEDWHRAGMLAHKQNVFDDFHAAAEWLVDEGWTTADRLSVSGGSNGGLLVGAALTQRPDLYAAVVCSAPLLDMVRYERFGLGATWNVEYGSADDPEQLGWLLAYSPYHAAERPADYPAVLFTVFDGDTRVDPMHARKMCAALQHSTTSPRPVLLRREADVGHGARAVTRSIELSVDALAFAAAWTGLDPGVSVPTLGDVPAQLIGLSVDDRLVTWPVAIVCTLVVAFGLRWLVRRLIDRGVDSASDNAFSRRFARARAGHGGDEAARVLAERTAARAKTVGSLLKSVASFVILFAAGVVILSVVGVNIAPIIASAGVVGIAVGFGAQSLVKDFLTGIFMVFEDQYGVGDEVDTGAASGTVEQVGLRVTRLRDDQGVIWYVPNGSVTRVGNKSQGFGLAVVEVQVAYGVDLPTLQQALTAAAEGLAHDADWDPMVLDEPALVSVESVSPEQVNVDVSLRTQPTRQSSVARELRNRVRAALDEAGIAPLRPPRTPH